MRILFLSTWFPYPPDNGSKLRVRSLLRGLCQHHDVTLLSFVDRSHASLPEPRTRLKAIRTVSMRPYNPLAPGALAGFFSPTPRVVVGTYQARMAELIREELGRDRYDLVVASQWPTAAYWSNFVDVPSVLEEIEVGMLEAKKAMAVGTLKRMRHQFTLLKWQFYLRQLLPHFRVCTVVSDVEAALIRRMVPGYHHLEVIPNGVNLEDYRYQPRAPRPNELIFTGSLRFFANYDAADWFLRSVYPRVQAAVPGVHLTVTGDYAHLPPSRSSGSVTFTGVVSDVHHRVASSWVSLAPIRLGGGTRFKILEAMALGTPIVATSKGAEGLEVQHDEHLLLADTSEAFAEATIRLLKDPALRDRLAHNAYQLVYEKYNWQAIIPRFNTLLEQVVGNWYDQ